VQRRDSVELMPFPVLIPSGEILVYQTDRAGSNHPEIPDGSPERNPERHPAHPAAIASARQTSPILCGESVPMKRRRRL